MRLYLSDLHLDRADSPQFQTLAALLQAAAPHCESIFILGDLFEVWIGDDDDGALANAVTSVFRETTRHCSLHLMHGNRDFLLGADFARKTGVRLLPDPYRLDAETLLSHGDGFCTDDAEYQQTRTLLRSETWQRDILAQSLDTRRQLAAAMRAQSRAANENKPANIMDVSATEVAREMKTQGSSRLIHGHTHRPGVHRESWGVRYVLGAWDTCGWLLRQRDDQLQLECFPLVGRCEI